MSNQAEPGWRRWKWDSSRSTVKPKPKKVKIDKAYDIVVNGLLCGLGKHPYVDQYYAEKLAIELNIESHIVKQVFHKLNLEGKMSQAFKWRNGDMHTRNDPWGDDVVQWEANWYNVYLDKF